MQRHNCGGKVQGAAGEELASAAPRYFDLFKYADKYDKALMLLGTVGAAGEGAAVPIVCLVLSKLINSFGSLQNDGSKMASEVSKYCLYMVYVGIFGWVTAYMEVSCWIRTGERQSAKIRAKYLRAILRQNVGFFDGKGTSTAEVVSNVARDSETVQDAMSEKVGNFIANMLQLVGAYIVGFYICWQLALIALALTPVVLAPGLMYKKALTDLTAKLMQEYDKANVVAEEAISSIRTVHSFAAENRTVEQFVGALAGTLKLGLKQGLAKGIALASSGISYLLWAVMSWVGQVLVEKHQVNGAEVVLLGFVIISGAISLSQATPSIRSFTEGTLAGHRMFQVINRVPPIDSDDMSGQILENIEGRIEFRDVGFCYPCRPEVQVLKAFNLRIAAGMNVALVGSSGSGKSTVIGLLERFYDPQRGEVLIDNFNIKRLQLKWLRMQIGLVSQEPALFATSIRENILYGKEGASMDEVVEAAKAANAHGFICQCPQGYDTQVGERGVQMSGGQKQRIAIARAILKNPPVLLLDEATSALDAESERVVQETLEQAAKGRTTLTVAHRLSTIRNADLIAVMQSGQVVELGDHEDLITTEGVYHGLVKLQQSQPSNVDAAKYEADQSLRNSLSRSQSKVLSRGSSRAASLRCSSLSRSLRMLTLSGSLKRALSEAFADKGDDFDTIFDQPDSEGKPTEKDPVEDVTIWRLLALNAPEWKEALMACVGAIGFGFMHPVFSYLLGQLLEAFYRPSTSTAKHEVRAVSGVFVGLMVLAVVTNLTQHYYFAIMGEELTARVRKMMLQQILRFEVGWFDRDENSSGAVCGRLGTDASLVRSLVGDRLSLMVSTISALAVAYTIGFVLSWRITVVLITMQPIIIICYCAKRMFLDQFAKISARGQLEASQVASEAVSQLRTITAFSSQDRVMKLFESKLKGPRQQTARRSHIAGIGVGASFGVMYSSWALMLWYGAQVVKQHRASFGTFIKAYFTLVATGRVLADAIIVLTPDLARSSQCVSSVFDILDRATKIEPDDERGEKPTKIDGNVELQNVTFAYPARPHILVFKAFQLKISAGRTVAMVGQSGSGKSTIISLIERFYDPLHGRVLVDGKDITLYNLRALRAHMGLVSQEPTLFAASIKQNIAYGRDNCTEAEIIQAAKAANAHTFISSLPDGYETFAGARGLLLSGGQKQRVAIARAVLKNPSILLLDEATSALDAESEAVVQGALDKMMVGRTTVVVAHRLSTIRQAHTIAVLQEGRILEQGTHEQLMGKEGGAYCSLVRMQTT